MHTGMSLTEVCYGLTGPTIHIMVTCTYTLASTCFLQALSSSLVVIPVPVHHCILSNGATSEAIVCGWWEASSAHVHT